MAAKKQEKEKVEKSKLEEIKAKMETKYGKGIVVSGSTKSQVVGVPTGSYRFDKITTCGGIPRGKLIEMFGPESSGKSTLSLEIIAQHQKAGIKCLLADFEHSFDAEYATTIGVDVDDLLITQPNTMEDGWNIIDEYVKSGEIGLIVLDSHTAMIPKDRLEGQIGDAKMAPEARLNSQALKKIKPELDKVNCTILGISQLRADIGSMGGGDKPTGGAAWKFYSDMRIKIFKQLDRTKELNNTTIEIIKNKCGKPYGKDIVPIVWGQGIDDLQEILDIAVETGIVNKAGSWYSYNGDKLGQGTAAVVDLLRDNEELLNEIKQKAIPLFLDAPLIITIPEEEGGGVQVVETVSNADVSTTDTLVVKASEINNITNENSSGM